MIVFGVFSTNIPEYHAESFGDMGMNQTPFLPSRSTQFGGRQSHTQLIPTQWQSRKNGVVVRLT